MKIRTVFVTNSSSYSGTEVVIDNPVLLEILQRYKEMGVFTGDELLYEIGSYGTNFPPSEGDTKTPAFFCSAEVCDYSSTPGSLYEVLESMIEIMDDCDGKYEDDLYDPMKEELHNRKDEIVNGFISVKWIRGSSSNEHDEDYNGYIEEEDEFFYDRTNGEESHYKKYTGNGSDDRMGYGVILEENHIINGEKIK